jgi:hypothetical protein
VSGRQLLRKASVTNVEPALIANYEPSIGETMKRLQLILLAFVVALALTSCAKHGASDDSLADAVKAKLYADPVAKQANINVAVKNGVVSLTGDAPTSDAELAAVKAANSVAGITRVDDQIKVATAAAPLPTAEAAAPPPANPSASAPAPAPAPAHAERHRDHERDRDRAATPVEQVVPSGTRVSVRTIDAISSKTATAGQTFRGTLTDPLTANGAVVVPAGANATLALAAAKGAGRINGSAQLQLRLASVEVNGQTYSVDSSDVTQAGKGRGKQTAVRTGIGAAAGAVIGALAGGGKGAAIGGAVGAGGGLGYQAFTHGQQVTIPSESVLVFTLQSPLTVR